MCPDSVCRGNIFWSGLGNGEDIFVIITKKFKFWIFNQNLHCYCSHRWLISEIGVNSCIEKLSHCFLHQLHKDQCHQIWKARWQYLNKFLIKHCSFFLQWLSLSCRMWAQHQLTLWSLIANYTLWIQIWSSCRAQILSSRGSRAHLSKAMINDRP